ncbi:MAG: hypothetical protein MZU95_14645 [Desulfomicrobium escambiense]|nr:hypothetical protein [Desulfomicrobium escambiense]
MAAYILFGIEAKHLLTAVIMTAPGTLMMAKMFVPETEAPETMGTVKLDVRADRRQRDRRRRARHRRRAAPGAERRRRCSSRSWRWSRCSTRCWRAALGRASQPRSRSSAGRSRRWPGRWACRGRTRRPSATCSARAWCSTSSSPISQLGAARRRVARPELVHHRDLRAVRLRELQLDRHPDRRHRRARARTGGTTWRASACGPCWPARWPTS